MQEHTYKNHTVRTATRRGDTWFVAFDILRATGSPSKDVTRYLDKLPNSNVVYIQNKRQAIRRGFEGLEGNVLQGRGAYMVNARGAQRLTKALDAPKLGEFLALVAEANDPHSVFTTYTEIDSTEDLKEVLNGWEVSEVMPGWNQLPTPHDLLGSTAYATEDDVNAAFTTTRSSIDALRRRIEALEARDPERHTLVTYLRKYQGGIYIGQAFSRFLALCFETARAHGEVVYYVPRGMHEDGFIPLFTLNTLNVAYQQLEV